MTLRDDVTWLLLGLGGLALLMKEEPEWGEGWHWPVPDMITPQGIHYPATITHEFEGRRHPGVDMMYRRRAVGDMPAFPPGHVQPNGMRDADRTGKFFAPPGTPILAARDAVVWSVQKSINGNGIFVVLDHGKPWATMYGHLETTTLPSLNPLDPLKKRVTVKAGDRIGTMGAGMNKDPSQGLVDEEHLRHLHFEAWYRGAANAAVDPERAMASWVRSTWTL